MIPALRWHYARGSRGLLGDDKEFARRILGGDLYTISLGDDVVGAVFFDVWSDHADVHTVRWGEVDRAQFVRAIQAICRREFQTRDLGTIRAEVPVSNKGAWRLAEDVGGQVIGRVERGIRLPGGGFSDTVLLCLTPEDLGGSSEQVQA